MGEKSHKEQKPLSFNKSNKPFHFYSSSSSPCSFTAIIIIILIFLSYLLYSFSYTSLLNPYSPSQITNSLILPVIRLGSGPISEDQTEIKHIVFGIAASADLWKHRSEYVKTWWQPNGGMNGAVWLDDPVNDSVTSALPEIKISSDTSIFKYRYRNGHRSAIRITRIVSETVRMLNGTEAEKNVRWLVMGDDDTVFFTEN